MNTTPLMKDYTESLKEANKEMTMGGFGELTAALEEAAKHGTKIIPIDSEHNAIFQVLSGTPEKVTITASGGPFSNRDNLASVTVAEATTHPKWKMGAKISVDSATLMNKGLELIEAHYLFDLPPEKLEVVVHPESIIHSIVTYADGSSLAQMAMPDMKVPISYVLAYPERLPNPAQRLNLAEIGSLNFFKPNPQKFKCLKIATSVLGQGQSYHIALSGANEVAVDSFLKGQIAFTQIADVVESAINQHKPFKINCIEDVFEADNQARQTALSSLNVAA
jgi:1-deoxy-D-xylulose-5-phosphate reductoisomerase